jgi:hypothetical protein
MAIQRLRCAECQDALRHAERAWHLHRSAKAARTAFVAAGALGNTVQLLRWRERAAAFAES